MKRTLFLTVALSAFAFCNAQTNLVQNPGFESGDLSPWVAGSSSYQVPQVISTTEAHEGTYVAAYLPVPTTGGTTHGFMQDIPVTVGHEYELSFWYKSDGIGSAGNSGVRIWSWFLNESNGSIYNVPGTDTPAVTQDPLRGPNNGFLPKVDDWTQCKVTFTPTDPEIVKFRFQVRVYSSGTNNAGNAYFDDFSLVDKSLGVDDVSAGKTQAVLAPTLVDNQISVLLSGKSKVDFYNINGALVKSVTVNAGESINAGDLQAGIYFVKVANGGKTQVVKIVKK